MLQNSSEYNNVGQGYGYGGGIPPIGLFGVISGDRHKHHDGDCEKALFTLNAIGNLKDTIAEAKDSLADRVDSTKDALTSRIENIRDSVVSEARSIDSKICEVRSDVKDSAYASAIQAERNTTEIKNQATAFQIANDRKFDELSREGERNTALILAKLNQDKIDDLRDELHGERRRGDNREVEINIANTNTNVLTAIQTIKSESDRKFDTLFASFSQLNRNTQDVINLGVMTASGNQANQQTNIK